MITQKTDVNVFGQDKALSALSLDFHNIAKSSNHDYIVANIVEGIEVPWSLGFIKGRCAKWESETKLPLSLS
jgi:hypothetical protein